MQEFVLLGDPFCAYLTGYKIIIANYLRKTNVTLAPRYLINALRLNKRYNVQNIT